MKRILLLLVAVIFIVTTSFAQEVMTEPNVESTESAADATTPAVSESSDSGAATSNTNNLNESTQPSSTEVNTSADTTKKSKKANAAKPKKEKKAKAKKQKKEKKSKKTKAKKAKPPKKIKYSAKAYKKAYSDGDYQTCIGMEFTKDKKGTGILPTFNNAILMHMKGDYAGSTDGLLKTSQMAEDFRKSNSQAFGAAMFNTPQDYMTNMYELFLVNSINALNYYNEGNLEDALVEIRKVDLNQKDILDIYNTEFSKDDAGTPQEKIDPADVEAMKKAAAKKKAQNDALNSVLALIGLDLDGVLNNINAPKPAKETDKYNDSSFVRYVGMKMYAMADDANAEVDAKKLAMMNSNFTDAVDSELKAPAGTGRLDVLALTGKIANRLNGNIYFKSLTLGATFPAITAIGSSSKYTEETNPVNFHIFFPHFDENNQSKITVKDVTIINDAGDPVTLNMKQLEDFDESVKKDINTKAYRAYVRAVFGALSKKFLAMITAEAVAESGLPIPEIALAGAAKTLEETDRSEYADLRQCYYLPRKAYANGVNLAPGKYTVKITYTKDGEDTIFDEDTKEVEIKDGKITLIESTCLPKQTTKYLNGGYELTSEEALPRK